VESRLVMGFDELMDVEMQIFTCLLCKSPSREDLLMVGIRDGLTDEMPLRFRCCPLSASPRRPCMAAGWSHHEVDMGSRERGNRPCCTLKDRMDGKGI
jgi:hypothetical protein